jgi:hypothetical protein
VNAFTKLNEKQGEIKGDILKLKGGHDNEVFAIFEFFKGLS